VDHVKARQSETGQLPAPEAQILAAVNAAASNAATMASHADEFYLIDNSGAHGEHTLAARLVHKCVRIRLQQTTISHIRTNAWLVT
jgi:hypothetical protein